MVEVVSARIWETHIDSNLHKQVQIIHVTQTDYVCTVTCE